MCRKFCQNGEQKGLFDNHLTCKNHNIWKKFELYIPWWFDLDGVTSPSSWRISKLGLLEIWSKGTAWDFFPIRFWVHLPGSFSFSRFLSLVNGKPEVDFFFSPRPRVCERVSYVGSKNIVYICRYSPQISILSRFYLGQDRDFIAKFWKWGFDS